MSKSATPEPVAPGCRSREATPSWHSSLARRIRNKTMYRTAFKGKISTTESEMNEQQLSFRVNQACICERRRPPVSVPIVLAWG